MTRKTVPLGTLRLRYNGWAWTTVDNEGPLYLREFYGWSVDYNDLPGVSVTRSFTSRSKEATDVWVEQLSRDYLRALPPLVFARYRAPAGWRVVSFDATSVGECFAVIEEGEQRTPPAFPDLGPAGGVGPQFAPGPLLRPAPPPEPKRCSEEGGGLVTVNVKNGGTARNLLYGPAEYIGADGAIFQAEGKARETAGFSFRPKGTPGQWYALVASNNYAVGVQVPGPCANCSVLINPDGDGGRGFDDPSASGAGDWVLRNRRTFGRMGLQGIEDATRRRVDGAGSGLTMMILKPQGTQL